MPCENPEESGTTKAIVTASSDPRSHREEWKRLTNELMKRYGSCIVKVCPAAESRDCLALAVIESPMSSQRH
jgi:hypothetical protein